MRKLYHGDSFHNAKLGGKKTSPMPKTQGSIKHAGIGIQHDIALWVGGGGGIGSYLRQGGAKASGSSVVAAARHLVFSLRRLVVVSAKRFCEQTGGSGDAAIYLGWS